MSDNMIEYGATRPTWAVEQFAQWLIEHCRSLPVSFCRTMPKQLYINGAMWIREQFRNQCMIEPDEETARGMFAAIVAIHFNDDITQQDIFQQIFEAYLRTIPAKA